MRLTIAAGSGTLNRMVAHQQDALSAVFRALGDPTRREMLRRLAEGEQTVGELGAPFRMSRAAVGKHVRVLEEAGLVKRTVQGREHHCRLQAERLGQAQKWLTYYERFWSERLDALDTLLAARRRARDKETKR